MTASSVLKTYLQEADSPCITEAEARTIAQGQISGARLKAFAAEEKQDSNGEQVAWLVDYGAFPGNGCIGQPLRGDFRLSIDCQGKVLNC